MKMKMKKLSVKLTLGLIILAVVICSTTCIIGYVKYKTVIEKMYNDSAYNIAYVARSYLDGDKIEQYLKTGKTDSDYNITLEKITDLRKNMGANYIYVSKLTGIDMVYVMDADNPNDSYDPFKLGDTGKINPNFKEDAKLIVEQGKRVDNYFYSKSQFGYNTSAIIPIYNSQKQIIGIVGVEVAMSKLQSTLFEYVLYAVIISSVLVILMIGCFLLYMRKKVINPIQLITGEAAKFAENETKISDRLDEVKTGDEIEALSAALKRMEIDTVEYISSITSITAEKERIGAELNVANHIQANMLPCIFPAFPGRDEFDIFASMTPAKEVGGDFYDFFLVDNDHLALVMADVSGKGVPAALFMVIAKTLLKNTAQTGLSPKETLENVNNQLCENNEAEMFVTVWMGIYEISTGKMVCANAGHEYPVIRHNGGDYELVKDKHGFVLAGMENAKYKEYELTLCPGDRLFVYTDGVAEATNAENELYGTDRMLAALNSDKDASCEDILHIINADIDNFVGQAPQFDDITMLSLRIDHLGGEDNG